MLLQRCSSLASTVDLQRLFLHCLARICYSKGLEPITSQAANIVEELNSTQEETDAMLTLNAAHLFFTFP